MKKKILAVAALCAVAVCSGACNTSSGRAEEYDALNSMLALNYSQITLTVKNTFDENNTLVSKYVIDYSGENVTVNYSIERFSVISLEPTSGGVKTTYTGEAVISGGAVTITEGDNVSVNADIAERRINFKEEYFANADMTGIYLKADVNNASGFMGSDIICTDMKVDATFLEIFYNLKITYTADRGNKVELLYVFSL